MTEKLYYQDSKIYSFFATVLSCNKQGNHYLCVLDKTAFFPEGGGQKADTGSIDSAEVSDVQEKDGIIYHTIDSPVDVGLQVICVLDADQRFRRMQNHTGEHVFSGVVHKTYGYTNIGFHMADDCMTVDFDGTLTSEQLFEIETECNRIIASDAKVNCIFPSEYDIRHMDYRSKFELTENVRLVEIEGCDLCACCAPHVESTAEVGLLKILDSMPHRGGTRITLVCGLDAFEHLREHYICNRQVSALLSAKATETPQAVVRLQESVSALKRGITALQTKMNRLYVDQLDDTDGSTVLFVEDMNADAMRDLCNQALHKCQKMMCVCCGNDTDGYAYIIASSTVNLRDTARQINADLNGRGGGQPTMIQGTFKASREQIENYFTQQ